MSLTLLLHLSLRRKIKNIKLSVLPSVLKIVNGPKNGECQIICDDEPT